MLAPPPITNGLKLSVAPTEEPLTRDEAKLYAQVIGDTQNTVMDGLIISARLWVESYTKRQLVDATWTLKLTGFPGLDSIPIAFALAPLSSITSIAYLDTAGDSQTWSSSLYQVNTDSEPGLVMPIEGESYPSTQSSTFSTVTVTFVAGYGAASAVPQRYKTAMGQLISHWFTTRESVSLIAGANITEIPLTVKSLLQQDRMWRF